MGPLPEPRPARQALARRPAPVCRKLRGEVLEALRDPGSPLIQRLRDWRRRFFPEASDDQFAGACAQAAALALPFGRGPGADSIPAGSVDPWAGFDEEFLAACDPKLRRDAGVYYTPVEVVRAQVRLVHDVLVNRLGIPLGFADPGVVTVDPATGTGTYLLRVIEHALARVESEQGAETVAAHATALAHNLYGFEVMVGPCMVAELSVSRALRGRGAALPGGGAHIRLADVLENPELKVGSGAGAIVCLGNPPYHRHQAASGGLRARTGAILRDFLDPAAAAGHAVHLKNLYNLYVYFWRWALWRVFEHESAPGPGVVSYISASSFLDGPAFCGMRQHLRRLCDEIWILDLGGEGRGPRQSPNLFPIRTPVAIAMAVRTHRPDQARPASAYYARIEGSRQAKLAALDAIAGLSSIQWQRCPDEWQAPFRPAGKGRYFDWPLLAGLVPWRHSGVQLKRTWPIAPDAHTLERRWRELLSSDDRSRAFHGTGDRETDGTYSVSLTSPPDSRPIARLPKNSPTPPVVRYAYRSFDRQFLIADGRLISRPRPALWRAHGRRQVYLTSLFSQPLGAGPALTASALIPDLDHFRGSCGAKAVIPLYRGPDGTDPNLLPGLLELLGGTYKRELTPEDFLAYLYGILAQPAFTASYAKELETRELRVPITRDPALFGRVRDAGARLLRLHTYSRVPRGEARCGKAVPAQPGRYPESFHYSAATRTLHVGDGEFSPVPPEVFEFEISGFQPVRSWLKYRMKQGAGRRSSPLDAIRPERWTRQFTTELLELLWVLEATVAGYPEQARLLECVAAGRCFLAAELP